MTKAPKRAASFKIPPTDRARLVSGLEEVPAVMVKWFLHHRDFPQYLGASKGTIIDRLLGHIEREDLTLADANNALREFHEFGAKEFRLVTFPKGSVKKVPASVAGARIDSLDRGRIWRTPIAPQINYSFGDGARLRCSFAETHEDLEIDPTGDRIVHKQITRVVVFDGDDRSGTGYLAFDPPRRKHPHGSSALDYYQHHLNAISSIVGSPLLPLPLTDCISNLELGDLVDVSRTEGKSGKLRVSLIASGTTDVRKEELYGKFADGRATADSATLVWRADRSNDKKGSAPRISRSVKTKIESRTSTVHFVQGTLEHESLYVIDQVRAHARRST